MRPTRRAGFTLVELLVVIAIIALLAALTAAGIGKVRNGQQYEVTNQTLTKLQLALNKRWLAVVEDARKGGVPGELITIAGDEQRGRSLYAYLKMKQALPQTFAEAERIVEVRDSSGASSPFILPKDKTFGRATTAAATAANLSVEEQGAVLLYMALAGKSELSDDVTQGAQGDLRGFTVFRDAWGTPITFARFFSPAEVQLPPYAKAGATARDPFDLSPPTTMPQGRLAATWTNKAAVLTGDGISHGLNTNAGVSPVAFDGSNKVITVVSAGADKTFQWNPADSDDSYGYRLAQQGKKGD